MIDPPTGTLTFLFTDIEGSTQLWEQHPEAMQTALARHDAILRQVIETHGGHVFKTVGDAFCAAFPSAPDAVSSALDAQRAIQSENWGETTIKVRMGLHSGAAEVRDNDYFGPALNRVARLMSAGHGGQTLLSAITRELAQPNLPPDAELRDMGERGLKDLIRPEHIYQLTATGLQADFPPLKTLEAFRTNLPVQLTSFIGREKEISAVRSLIAEHRLTTLTGSGGTGKTRLSLQVAADLLDSFPDGVWFVEFAPLSSPALVPQTVLTTLGLREETGGSALEILTHYLHTKKVLLILDNCEHLVEAAAQFADELLRACLNLRLLVSSREALGVPGEKAHHVKSLSTPQTNATLLVKTATQYEAVRLFVDRAKTVSSTFTMTSANVSAVAQICSRLDGIPLAIELAAARVKMLKADQIAERLDDRFRLLTGGSRTALPRQQTLRAMIDWSYDLLPEAERVLLLRLSVFAGGWTLEAAETVCQGSGIDDYNVLDPLAQLVNKSLVVVDADIVPVWYDNTETRYRLLETVRQYAREKLSETGEGMMVRDAHLQYFLGLAERAEPQLVGPQVLEWMDKLEIELDNIRAALEWSLNRNAQIGLQLICALRRFLIIFPDSDEWLNRLANHPKAQARTIFYAKVLGMLGEQKGSQVLIEESLALYQALGDRQGMANNLYILSRLENGDQTEHLFAESQRLYQEIGDKVGMADSFIARGVFLGLYKKDYERAHIYLEEGLAIAHEIEYSTGIEIALFQLAQIETMQANYLGARHWLDQLTAREIQDRGIGAEIFILLGRLSYWQGNYAEARSYYTNGLDAIKSKNLTKSYDDFTAAWLYLLGGYATLREGDIAYAQKSFLQSYQRFIAQSSSYSVCALEGFASLATLQAQYKQAAQLFAYTDMVRETLANHRPPNEQADVNRDLTTIHAQLNEAAFAAAQAAGRAMTMDQAIAYALESTHPSINSHRPDVPSGG
jgi:predicted ATPase/class 3 adenylate cyclase